MEAFIPNQQKGNFIMTPEFILESKTLAQGAKTVFTVLAGFARSKSYCYPSQDTIANKTGASINSIRTWLNQLVNHGFLKIVKNEQGKNVYHLFSPIFETAKKQENQDQDIANLASDKVQNLHLGIANFAYEINNINKIKQIPPFNPSNKITQHSGLCTLSAGGGVNFSFEDLWNLYPRKENKEKAKISFNKLLKAKNIPQLTIFQKAIDFFKNTAQWQREHGRFIPQLHNFLLDKRWADIRWEDVPAENSKPVQIVLCESLQSKSKRRQKEEQERVKSLENAKKWQVFSSYFNVDNDFLNRFLAEQKFNELISVPSTKLLNIKQKQNITVYEYFKRHNLIKERK